MSQTVKGQNITSVGNKHLNIPCSRSQIRDLRLNVASTKYQTLLDHTDTAYVVPANKVLYIVAAYGGAGSSSNAGQFSLGYGDTNVSNSASAPTNGKGLGALYSVVEPASAGTIIPATLDILAIIPAGKYPCGQGNSASTVDVRFIAVECDA